MPAAERAPGNEPSPSWYASRDNDEDDSFIEESSAPIVSNVLKPIPSVPMLTDMLDSAIREYIKGLQLTRDFVRTMLRHPDLSMETTNFFVRLNMGSRFFMYVAAQVVSIDGDEVQVRGVDRGHPTRIQNTKLAYVSNATFKEDEITSLIHYLRTYDVLNLAVSKAEEMIDVKNSVLHDPLYKALRLQMQQHSSVQASADSPAPEKSLDSGVAPQVVTTSQASDGQPFESAIPRMMQMSSLRCDHSSGASACGPASSSEQQVRLRQGWKPPEACISQPILQPASSAVGDIHTWSV